MSDPDEEDRSVRTELSHALDRFITHEGPRSSTSWARGSAADLRALARTAAGSTRLRNRWRQALPTRGTNNAPDDTQRTALETLADYAGAPFELLWAREEGSPRTLTGLLFVQRERDPLLVWSSFLRQHGTLFRSIYGIRHEDELEYVDQRRNDEFIRLRFARRMDGIRVPAQSIQVDISHSGSRLGPGVLWRIQAGWTPYLHNRRTSVPQTAWLSEDSVRARYASERPFRAHLEWSCGTTCVPHWIVPVQNSEELRVDAQSGRLLSRVSLERSLGPLQISSYPPGATTQTPVRFRNAAYFGDSTVEGATTRDTGEHTEVSASSFQIGLEGAYPTSPSLPAPTGRVERRTGDNAADPIVSPQTTWTPATQPSHNFSSAWSPSSTTLANSTQIVYGWLSYWQSLFADQIGSRVPDTLTFVFTGPALDNTGIYAALFSIRPDPVHGQQTRVRIEIGTSAADDIGTDRDGALYSMAHEFGHAIHECNTGTGSACENRAPQTLLRDSSERMPADSWRGQHWRDRVEGIPNAIAFILNQFRPASVSPHFVPSARYQSYDSPSDGFYTPTQAIRQVDPASITTNCLDSATPCPTGFSCSTTNQHNPVDPAYGLCMQECTGSSDCTGSSLSNPADCAIGVCEVDTHKMQLFANAVQTFSLERGWFHALAELTTLVYDTSERAKIDVYANSSDTYLARSSQANPYSRYEWSRAWRSVTVDPPFPEAPFVFTDDFTDEFWAATPVPVVQRGTGNWIRSGAGGYGSVSFTDPLDMDYILFRGVRGAVYETSAYPGYGSFVDLAASVWRWTAAFDNLVLSTDLPDGPGVTLRTPPLPENGWYALRFNNRSTLFGDYTGFFGLAWDSIDEFADTAEDAWPMASGETASGSLAGEEIPGVGVDADRFRIDVPSSATSSSLTITVNDDDLLVPVAFEVVDPTGTSQGSWLTTHTFTAPMQGRWYWRVVSPLAISYNTTASIGCMDGSPTGCDRANELRGEAANTWGDRFAGRLPRTGQIVTYDVPLQERQHLTVGLANSDECQLAIQVLPVSEMRFFHESPSNNPIRMVFWREGTAWSGENAPMGPPGIGGHFTPPLAGAYRVQVINMGSGSCANYRLSLATAPVQYPAMPSW